MLLRFSLEEFGGTSPIAFATRVKYLSGMKIHIESYVLSN